MLEQKDYPEEPTEEQIWRDDEGRFCMTAAYLFHAANLEDDERDCPVRVGNPHPESPEWICVSRNPIKTATRPNFWRVKAEFIKAEK